MWSWETQSDDLVKLKNQVFLQIATLKLVKTGGGIYLLKYILVLTCV